MCVVLGNTDNHTQSDWAFELEFAAAALTRDNGRVANRASSKFPSSSSSLSSTPLPGAASRRTR